MRDEVAQNVLQHQSCLNGNREKKSVENLAVKPKLETRSFEVFKLQVFKFPPFRCRPFLTILGR